MYKINKMKKEFVPYELALKLKQLGFKYPCFGRYYNEEFELDHGAWNSLDVEHIIAAPTFSQAFRWFREEHGLFGTPDISNFENKTYGYAVTTLNHPHYLFNAHSFSSMEEAELACLDKLIEIVELKQKER